MFQHYAAVTHSVIRGLKTIPGYVKTGLNAQSDLDTPPRPHAVLTGEIFSPRGITSPVDISFLKQHLFYGAKSVQNKFKVPKLILITFFEQRERWRDFTQRLLCPMSYLYLA